MISGETHPDVSFCLPSVAFCINSSFHPGAGQENYWGVGWQELLPEGLNVAKKI